MKIALALMSCLTAACAASSNPPPQAMFLQLLADSDPITSLAELDPYVWCGDYSEGYLSIPTPSVHVALWPLLDPDFELDTSDPASGNGWIISARLDDIQPGEPIGLPLQWDSDQWTRAAVFARVLSEEYSSESDTSSGSIIFDSTPCIDGNETVKFSIDAELNPEDGDSGSIHLVGSFRGGFNEPPQRGF